MNKNQFKYRMKKLGFQFIDMSLSDYCDIYGEPPAFSYRHYYDYDGGNYRKKTGYMFYYENGIGGFKFIYMFETGLIYFWDRNDCSWNIIEMDNNLTIEQIILLHGQ